VLAANVLAYTIHKFATRPVRVVPMHNLNIPVAKDQKSCRTGFSFTRFVIPELANTVLARFMSILTCNFYRHIGIVGH